LDWTRQKQAARRRVELEQRSPPEHAYRRGGASPPGALAGLWRQPADEMLAIKAEMEAAKAGREKVLSSARRALSSAAAADGAAQGRHGRHGNAALRTELDVVEGLFDALDVNGDGKISRQEFDRAFRNR
jgi:hypothetical protein